MGYSRKKPNSGGWGHTFLKKQKKNRIFSFFYFIVELGKFMNHNFDGKFYTPGLFSAIGFTYKVYI